VWKSRELPEFNISPFVKEGAFFVLHRMLPCVMFLRTLKNILGDHLSCRATQNGIQ